MDADERESIGEKFEILQSAASKQEKVNFQLTSIVEKSMTEKSAFATACNANGKLINGITKIIENENRSIQILAFMQDLQFTFMVLKNEIEKKIANVHDTLVKCNNNLLSTKLITYTDMVAELKNFQMLDSESILPIDVKNPDLEILRKIMKYGVVLANNNLFLVFSIPTLQREKLFLTKL